MDQTNQKDTITQNESLTAVFVSDNQTFSYVHKKLEKLVSALYIVTDFMDLNEPIRTKLRVSGTELLVYLSRTYSEGEREKKASLRYALNELSAIVSLCEVARSTGAVSQMNFSILREEFLSLINLIESKFSGLTSAQSVRNLVALPFHPGSGVSGINSYSGMVKKDNVASTVKDSSVKDISVFNKKGDNQNQTGLSDSSSRQDKIMSFIKKHGPSSIKDIASVIVGCSEKTVQRDLVSLVSRGDLQKKGERRWSVYSIRI